MAMSSDFTTATLPETLRDDDPMWSGNGPSAEGEFGVDADHSESMTA
jgi:hypothetical protein